jgi:hypothetical protein
MKKEMIISILVGLIFGLIITYGVYRAKTSLSQPPSPEPLFTSPSPTPGLNTGMLVLISPEDETVQDSAEIAVTGTAPANSHIIVFINDVEYITTADETDHFSITGKLESGSNVIAVHAINEQGETAIEERTVIMSTADLNSAPQASESAKPTPKP